MTIPASVAARHKPATVAIMPVDTHAHVEYIVGPIVLPVGCIVATTMVTAPVLVAILKPDAITARRIVQRAEYTEGGIV